ncbi:MAG: hypothetical protein Q9164_000718 [Protoblastenia rupestris]
MTETRRTDLVYGHLGRPVYDTESRQWHFPREPGIRPRIRPLGQPKIVLESSRPSIEDQGRSAVDRAQGVKDLSQVYPEFCPAADLLPGLAQVSEAVNQASSNHDPSFSDLIAFGKVTNASKTRAKSRELPCVAVAAGPAGELVRFVLLRKEQLGWQGHKAFGLQALTVTGGEQGWWTANGSPVQQIVFATDSEGDTGTLLAVRYHGAISILRPMLRPCLVSPIMSATDRFQLPASRIEAMHIVTLAARCESLTPFADMAFNPWDHQQVATIDQAGEWSIWNLTPPDIKGTGSWAVTLVCSGRIQYNQEANSPCLGLMYDGWAKIAWAENFRTLVTASRRSLGIVMVDTKPKATSVPDLALAGSMDEILDIQRSPSIPGQVFVVTSTRLFWLAISTSSDIESGKNVRVTVRVLLSWVHYRSPNDISLQLRLLVEVEKTLEEEENPAQEGDENEGTIQPLSNPVRRTVALILQSLLYGSLYGHPASDLAQHYSEKRVIFFQLSTLYNDLSVSESLYVRSPLEAGFEIDEPNVRTRLEVSKTPLQLHDDFIVPDGIAHEECFSTKGVETGWRESPQELTGSTAEDLRTINLEWLVERMRSGLATNQEQPEQIIEPFESVLGIIEAMIKDKLSSEEAGSELL